MLHFYYGKFCTAHGPYIAWLWKDGFKLVGPLCVTTKQPTGSVTPKLCYSDRATPEQNTRRQRHVFYRSLLTTLLTDCVTSCLPMKKNRS